MRREREKSLLVLEYLVALAISISALILFFMGWFGGSGLVMILAVVLAMGSVLISRFFVFILGWNRFLEKKWF